MSDTLSISGKVKSLGQPKNISLKSGETMTIKTAVITTDDKYPQDIPFEAVNDKASLFDGLKPGQTVTVYFNLRSYEYNGETRMSAPRVWKLEGGTTTAQPAAAQPATAFAGQDNDGLPF
jgi:hypothetical protein